MMRTMTSWGANCRKGQWHAKNWETKLTQKRVIFLQCSVLRGNSSNCACEPTDREKVLAHFNISFDFSVQRPFKILLQETWMKFLYQYQFLYEGYQFAGELKKQWLTFHKKTHLPFDHGPVKQQGTHKTSNVIKTLKLHYFPNTYKICIYNERSNGWNHWQNLFYGHDRLKGRHECNRVSAFKLPMGQREYPPLSFG